MGQNRGRKNRGKNRQKQTKQRSAATVVTTAGPKFQTNAYRGESEERAPRLQTPAVQSRTRSVFVDANEVVTEKPLIKIDRERIKATLTELCEKLSTDTISVEVTEDTRKLDAGIVYYIVHIKKPSVKKAFTKKTGIYFTRVKDCVHVQVINGTSMVLLFSNYSDNSQTNVFKYVENVIRKDMEFYQDTLEAIKSRPRPMKKPLR